MKTLKQLTLLAAFFISTFTLKAVAPVCTYTFVDPCMAFAIISPIPGTYGCFSFSATTAGASDPNGYFQWNFGDGTSGTGNYLYHCYPMNNSNNNVGYSVTVQYVSPSLCGPVPVSSQYSLSVGPPPQSVCTDGTRSVSVAAKSVTVEQGSSIPEIIFSYRYGDGSSSSPSNEHTYASCGNYIVVVKRYNPFIHIDDSCFYYVAVNIACTSTATGISENTLDKTHSRVFPNPASELVHILPAKAIRGIKLVDVWGRCCRQETLSGTGQTAINISELRSGPYFIKIMYSDYSEDNIKFIKE